MPLTLPFVLRVVMGQIQGSQLDKYDALNSRVDDRITLFYRPFLNRASTPSTRGCSGPGRTRLTSCFTAKATRRSKLSKEIFTFVVLFSEQVPPLPGAT